MIQTKTLTNYDANALDFDQFRQPNSFIAKKLVEAFSVNEGPILSVGCGTGQYEAILSKKLAIVGMDRSNGMIGKAKERISSIIRADMTFLPFAKESFSGAYFMQSLHHVGANLSIGTEQRNDVRRKVLKQTVGVLNRGPLFIIQRDPSQNQAVWFWKYFPRALEIKMMIQPKIALLAEWLGSLDLENVAVEPINDPMIQGFYDPKAPLDPGFRRSFSEFSYLSENDIQIGMRKLDAANRDGSVMDDIDACKLRFSELGGTVYVISGEKL